MHTRGKRSARVSELRNRNCPMVWALPIHSFRIRPYPAANRAAFRPVLRYTISDARHGDFGSLGSARGLCRLNDAAPAVPHRPDREPTQIDFGNAHDAAY